jgi:hypothetical protein
VPKWGFDVESAGTKVYYMTPTPKGGRKIIQITGVERVRPEYTIELIFQGIIV